MQIDMKCMLCCTNSFFFMFYHSKSMGGAFKRICQVYKLLLSDKVRTNGVTGFQEANPIPAIFYFIYFTVFY